ncbi:MAG: hypothetical protein WC506_06920 [Candidatus Micrarchaeia archaeon]
MDDFAHLLVGYSAWRIARLAGLGEGKWACLAAALAGSVMPDLLWPWGVFSYVSTHAITYYAIFALPFLLWGKSRAPAALFIAAVALHIAIDIPMHAGTYAPFAPISDWKVTGFFNYWSDWGYVAAYWIGALALAGATFLAEWKKTGGMTLGCDAPVKKKQ